MQIENLTPAMERILRLAEIEAGKDKSFIGVNKSFIGVNHVLIGMMLEGDNYASLNLKASGFTVEGLRNLQAPNG